MVIWIFVLLILAFVHIGNKWIFGNKLIWVFVVIYLNGMRGCRNAFIMDKWFTRARVNEYGSGRLYMSIYHASWRYFDGRRLVVTHLPDVPPKNVLLPALGGLEDYLPTIGDLVAVKCDLQFVSTAFSYPNHYFLPPALKDKFIMVDIVNHTTKGSPEETKYIPTLTLNCFLDVDGMLELTGYDYEESMTDTKRWDMREHGGLRLRDYVTKRSKILNGDGQSIGFSAGDSVNFHQIAWLDTDMITGIPGVVETRRQKHWFFNNTNNNIHQSSSDLTGETYVKFPLCGLVGTLMDYRVVTHSLTADGQYVGGNDYKTIFYKIWFSGRIPVWVDAPVWACPDPLSLPILLPIP